MRLPLLTILSFLFIQQLSAQQSYRARIVDEQGQPLAGAVITINGIKKPYISDSTGFFEVGSIAGNVILRITHVGFLSNTVRLTGVLPAEIKMHRDEALLDETIVKAFENNSSPRELGAAVTILNEKNLRRFESNSLVAAVNTTPGVKMDERSPGSYRLGIRGNLLRSTFGVRNVKVYWNNIPFTDASGNTYLNLLPSKILSRMEIIRGPSGSMYGGGTSGVVLLGSATKVGPPEKTIELNMSAGSYGQLAANVGYFRDGKNNTALNFSHQQADGYRQHTEMRRDVMHYAGNRVLTKNHQLFANVFLADLMYETPGALTLPELNKDPRQARPAAGAFQGAITQKAAVYLKTIYSGLSLQSRINERWNNATGVYGSYTDFTNPTIRNFENKYDRGIGGRTVFQHKRKYVQLVLGAEVQSGFFYAAVHGNKQGNKDTLQFQDDLSSRQMNLFTQADFFLPAGFHLNAGVSYNRYYYGYQRVSKPGSGKERSNFSARVIPRVSLLKNAGWITAYAAFGEGYSVPSIDEVHAGNDVFNRDLKSETAINYEAGLKAEPIKNKCWLNITYYFLSLQNTIVSRRDAAGGDYYLNAGKTKQRGLEMSAAWLPLNQTNGFVRTLRLNAAFTNLYARFRDYQQGQVKFDGKQLTGTVPNILNVGGSVSTSPGIAIDANYSYTDHTPLNDANTFWGRSYQLLFVKLAYERSFLPRLESAVFFTYEKSLQQPYSLGNDLNAAGNRFFNPSAPQQFNTGIRLRYKLKPTSRLIQPS